MKPVLLFGRPGAASSLMKARVSGYTRSDGTYVQEHQDSRPDKSQSAGRVPMKDGKIATKKFDGPEHEAASHDAVDNPLYHKDADAYGGAPPSRIEFERKGVSHVDHSTIISPQRSLNPRKVNRIASEFDDGEADPVRLVRMPDGRHVLADGNHRTAAAIMSGRSKVKAHVIDHSEINNDMNKSIFLFGRPGAAEEIEAFTKAQVKGYTRSDGTFVKPHTTSRARAKPKDAANAKAGSGDYDHPHVVGRPSKLTNYQWTKETGSRPVAHTGKPTEAHEITFAGRNYMGTGKTGKSAHDGTPVRAFDEGEDGHRVWLDDQGRVHADSIDEVKNLRKRHEEYSAQQDKR